LFSLFLSPDLRSSGRFPAWRDGTSTLFDYQPARLQYSRVAELIPWNRFLGSLNVYNYGLWPPCCCWRP
jgi:hypothetical protein